MANVTFEKGVFQIVPGGHTDSMTGSQCHWNVFRICNTTRMETNSVSKLLSNSMARGGTPSPRTMLSVMVAGGFRNELKAAKGTKTGGDMVPLHSTDFSSYLIKAQSTNPDAIILLLAGDDMINCLKQSVQFGLDKKFHIAGAQQELEVNEGLPPQALFGDWVFEWYWKQPNVPHVAEFIAEVRKRSGGKVPTARTWFGYAAVHTCKLAAEKAKSVEPVKLAKAMQGGPTARSRVDAGRLYYREGDHQLMSTLFVGHSQPAPAGGDPEDLFAVTQLVNGDQVALPVDQTGCRLVWPT